MCLGVPGNVLTVGSRGAVINISALTITAGNTLNMAGGLIQAPTTSSGSVRGFGTVSDDVTIESGGILSPANELGQLTFSNNLTLASNATTTVRLGTNCNPTVVNGNLTLNGILNVTDGSVNNYQIVGSGPLYAFPPAIQEVRSITSEG